MRKETPEQSLEWYQHNFHENCEACHERIEVHAFRAKQNGNRRAVYGHCTKEGCRKKNAEVCYLGT